MVRAGLMSERDYDKRRCTRDVARKIRHRDDLSNWPRDVNTKPYRYRRLRDGKEGRWGEVTKDQREGDSYVRVGDETLLHQNQALRARRQRDRRRSRPSPWPVNFIQNIPHDVIRTVYRKRIERGVSEWGICDHLRRHGHLQSFAIAKRIPAFCRPQHY